MNLKCVRCGRTLDASISAVRCACGGLLEVRHDLGELDADELRRLWTGRRASLAPEDRSGVWRFRELVAPPGEMVTRGEGNTGLYPVPELAGWAGVGELFLKHEGENPTGSFKDRGMTVGVSAAKRVGARVVACASTGNTSASLASYAAISGLACVVLVPAGKVSGAKLSQATAYGARTLLVRGNFDAALSLLQSMADELELYVLNSVNPWRLEGQKTVMLEVLEMLGWRAPDWVVLPGGNLGNTAAFGKALEEARDLGLIERLPRMAVVQAEGAAPFVRAFESGWTDLRPVLPETVATAIRIGNPVNYPKARDVLRALDGVAVAVSDREILEAKALVDRSGVGCEPASAASLAGLKKLRERGVISEGSRVVCVLTGHILKDPDATTWYHSGCFEHSNQPVEVEASEQAIRTVMGRL